MTFHGFNFRIQEYIHSLTFLGISLSKWIFCMYCKPLLLPHLEMHCQVCVLIFLTLFLYANLQWLKLKQLFPLFCYIPVKDCNKTRIPCSFCGTPHLTVHISMRFFQNFYITSFENIGWTTFFCICHFKCFYPLLPCK